VGASRGVRHSGWTFLRTPVAGEDFRRADEICWGEAQSKLDVDTLNGEARGGSDGIAYIPLKFGEEADRGRSVLSGSFVASSNIGESLNVSPSSTRSGLVRTPISGPAPVISIIGVSGRGDSFGDITYNAESRRFGDTARVIKSG
jgi:hypothetical protein